MRRIVGGGLVLSAVTAASLALAAPLAGAGPLPGPPPGWTHRVSTEGAACFAPSVGPISVMETLNIWEQVTGRTTTEVGTVRLSNDANGHSHTFAEAGIVTDEGRSSAPSGGDNFLIQGVVIWMPRDDIQYVVGTASSTNANFDQITSHVGLLYEACQFIT